MKKKEPYHFVRFLWADSVDLDAMAEEFAEYVVGWRIPPESLSKMDFHIYNLKELKLKADTLSVFISITRAILFQRKQASFTNRDAELRRRVFEIFPRSRPTPFPFLVVDEPDFEVEEKVPA